MKRLFLAAMIFAFLNVSAQDTLMVARADLLKMTAEKNFQVMIAQQDYASAKADYTQSMAVFLPRVSASHTATATTNPLMSFGSKLNQEILTASDFNPALLNDPAKTKNFATVFEVQQPIFNLDGIFGRQAAKAKMDAYRLQAGRTSEAIQLEVSKAYMQLQLAYKAVDVLQRAETTAKANRKMIENYFSSGMLQKTDVLNVGVRSGEISNQLQYARSQVRDASDYLALLTGQDLGKVMKPTETLDKESGGVDVRPELPLLRKDIQAMDLSAEAYGKMYDSGKAALLPRLNAFGNYQLFDDKWFATGARGWLVGAQLSWNVFDGMESIGKIEKARAEMQKARTESQQYKAKSQMEIDKTVRGLADAANKLALASLALEQSQEAYRIRHNRFGQGLEKTTDLLQSETQMYQKELERLQAVFDYNFTKQYLEFLTN